MKYKKLPIEKKREIVEEVMSEKNIADVARKYDIPYTTVVGWLSNDEIYPDKEYASIL